MSGFSRRRMAQRIIVGLIFAIILVWIIDLAWNAARLYGVFQEGRALAQAGLQNAPVEQLAGLAQRAYPPLAGIRRDVRPLYPLFWLGQSLPRLGPLMGQVEPGLEAGVELMQAGVTLLPVLQPVWEGQSSAGGPGRLESLVQNIAQNAGPVAEASAAVERAAPYIQRLDPQVMPASLSDNLAMLKDNFPLLLAGARLLPDLPGLMGASAPQTYLVLAQNNDELRPTGGFISGMGEILLDNGKVVSFSLPDAYDVDNDSVVYPPPPEPIQRYMLSGYWMPRDANWSPDFPTAAQQVQALYTLSNGRTVNGVLAFDQAAIQNLLVALGPVPVPSYPEPLTATNVVQAMRSAWDPGSGQTVNNAQWYQNRKNFMGDMGKAIMSELLALRSPSVALSVVRSLLYSLRAGHLQVYFNDAAAQAQLAGLDLDGSVHAVDGDFVMLVDWNFGFNKVDSLVQRSLAYAVDLSDPRQPLAQLSARYFHTLSEPVTCRAEAQYGQYYNDLLRRCFWSYWRVYAAPGARLSSVMAPPLPGQYLFGKQDWNGVLDVYAGEGGAQVFGGPIMLAAQGQGDIVLGYQLPAGILQSVDGALIYRLRLQKQAGLLNLPVQVRVTPPAGYRFEALTPGWMDDSGTALWQGTLEAAQEIALRFSPRK